MGDIGFPELLLILFVVLLLFGGQKLPEIAKSLGKSIYEFKKALKEREQDTEQDKPAVPKQVAETSAENDSKS